MGVLAGHAGGPARGAAAGRALRQPGFARPVAAGRRALPPARSRVLVSTHVLDYVRDYPRVLWLEQGQLRLDGPGQQVCAAYEAHVRRLGIDQGWAQHG